MSEVSARVLELYPEMARRHALSIEDLTAGLEENFDGREWVPWPVLSELNRRLGERVGSEGLEEAGGLVLELAKVGDIVKVLSLGVSLRTVFKLSHRYGGPAVFPGIKASVLQEGTDSLLLGIRHVDDEDEISMEFLLIVKGFLSALPKLLAAPPCPVRVSRMERGAVFHVVLPRQPSFWFRVRRAWAVLWGEREEREDPLTVSYSALFEQQNALSQRYKEALSLRVEAERAREVAEEAARHRSEFVAVVSHELRTPMTAVIGNAELLEHTRLDEQQRDYVFRIGSAARALELLVDDVLTLSTLDLGATQLSIEPMHLGAFLDVTHVTFAQSALDKGLGLLTELLPGLPTWCQAAPLRVRQLITNLVQNAIKYTESGWVRLRVGPSAEPGWMFIEVEDTGPGIPKAERERIFEPFRRVDSSTRREKGGTGLGLAITRRLVNRMGGHVELLDKEGPGALFRAELPVTASAGLPETLRPPAASFASVLVCGDSARSDDLDEVLARRAVVAHRVRDLDEAVATLRDRSGFRMVIAFGACGEACVDEMARFVERERILIIDDEARPELSARVVPDRWAELEQAVAETWARFEETRIASHASPQELEAPPRVLAVDDTLEILLILEAQLKLLGCEVELMSSGVHVAERILQGGIDVLLVDLHMPQVSGDEVARAVREAEAREGRPPVYIVGLSADVRQTAKAHALEVGMDRFVRKPMGLPELRELLAARPGEAREEASSGSKELVDPSGLVGLRELEKATGKKDLVDGLIQRFADSCASDVVDLAAAVAGQDGERAHAAAHRMKGRCLSLGAVAMAARMQRICEAALAGEPQGELLIGLEEELRQTVALLRTEQRLAKARSALSG
ncbi:MAG: response regulator [Alphaproteobacteria bacterium]|nr:response regulator [Alphaproteobacteria bacterium]